MTLRDDSWNAVLSQIAANGKFKMNHLPFKKKEQHTVRRALNEMEKFGWLERESRHAAIWRAGPKARSMLRMSDEVREESRQ